jgi:hypothetical protein
MRSNKVKVLYIVGGWRSGSTLIDNLLGQVDGFFSVGEIYYMWDDNLIGNRLCGCGNPFRECEVWRGIMDEAYGGMELVDANEMVRLRKSGARTRHIPLLMMPQGESLFKSRLGSYLDNLERLYQGISSSTGSSVVVDSSKLVLYGYLLGMLPSIDLYVVHLVRDSRAVTYSWMRSKFQPDIDIFMPRYSPAYSALLWNATNLAVESLWRDSPERYMRLRYEDFIARPKGSVAHMLELVGESNPELPFVDDHRVDLGVNHTVSGNPGRFKTGVIELRPDEEWRAKIKRPHRKIVTALTFPLLLKYGYLGKRPAPGKSVLGHSLH